MSVAQSCLTLCDPMDCSLPGSSVHGILQVRILEWTAISSSSQEYIKNSYTLVPWWLRGKEPACQRRRLGFDPWVKKIPLRMKWQPTPVFLPGESHGQRSRAGYAPWGCRESDTTWWLNSSSVDRGSSELPASSSSRASQAARDGELIL